MAQAARDPRFLTVANVLPESEEPLEVVGGSAMYFWQPENHGRGYVGRITRVMRSLFGGRRDDDTLLPNVRNADLGVPVLLGKDHDGVRRYVYLMGDTGGQGQPRRPGREPGGVRRPEDRRERRAPRP